MNAEETLETVRDSGLMRGGWSRFRRRVLVLGSGKLAKDLCEILLAKRVNSYEVVGFLDGDTSRIGERVGNPRIIGTYEQLVTTVGRHDVHTIVVCMEDRRSALPVQTLLEFKAMGMEVVDGHVLYEEESGRLSIDFLRPSALVFSAGFKRRAFTMGVKRLIDVVVATVGLIAFAPLFGLIGLLIKIDSSGPVFYRQMRVGLQGRPYLIWKFRSMVNDAEKSGPRWAEASDPRISRVGRWLRKWRLDELPQLINVFKGEMSLAGPRPERPVFVQELRKVIPYYDIRHTVRPGITGWAQIKFRYGASEADSHVKLQYDLYYVKNMNLMLDCRIVIETIRVMFLGEGAR